MPGIFSCTAATNPAFATGGTNGPAALAPANNLPLAGEVGPVASRGESQAVWRIFS